MGSCLLLQILDFLRSEGKPKKGRRFMKRKEKENYVGSETTPYIN